MNRANEPPNPALATTLPDSLNSRLMSERFGREFGTNARVSANEPVPISENAFLGLPTRARERLTKCLPRDFVVVNAPISRRSRPYSTSVKPPLDNLAVLDSPSAMQAWSAAVHAKGKTIALVPTMGALHDGHLALARLARSKADVVILSIFVNPLQFNSSSDFAAYPRPIDGDLELCRTSGLVDAVYAPTAAAMYPSNFQTHIEPGILASKLEGEHRPGHFRGVTTVVSKLINACDPTLAIFGQKDFQQLAIVRRMVSDLDMKVEIVGMPTVRERDGLAMSSRNRRLTPEQRAASVCISKGLFAAKTALEAGERGTEILAATVAKPISLEPLARLEYVEVVDPDTLEKLHYVANKACVLVAVWFGEVRLIDNVVIG
jgi:pantoate--beta-alanine ligase